MLVATDAAGEGINLQRAHLMVNYDLPWNPNRIEQRFGRVHRIGQTEVCHLWNLVAEDTREGDVFQRLFTKLDEQRSALGGQVFDVLGQAFARHARCVPAHPRPSATAARPDAAVKDKLNEVLDATVGDALRQVIHDRALVTDLMTAEDVERIREDMERAQARKLQPYFVRSFFLEAFAHLGGEIREREPGRFEITKGSPPSFRQRDRADRHRRAAVAPLRADHLREGPADHGGPAHCALAQYLAPGHPLLDVTVDLIIERFDSLLQRGAVLVDERDPGEVPRTLIYLQHAVADGRVDPGRATGRTVSKRFEFVEVGS